MNKRKYPLTLFLSGCLINLIKTFYIFLISFLLFVTRTFIPTLPIIVPIGIIILWILMACITQFNYMKIIQSKGNNGEFDAFLDKVLDNDSSDNWRQNAIDFVNEKIEENKNNL